MREAPPRGMGQGFNALAAAAERSAFACDAETQTCAQRQGNDGYVVARLVGRGLVIETHGDHGDYPTAKRQPAFRSVPTPAVRNVQHGQFPFSALRSAAASRHSHTPRLILRK